MGEARRLREHGIEMKQIRPGEQIQVDLKNAKQIECEDCGCKFFEAVICVYRVSALVSPTGQEIAAQRPVLICRQCQKPLEGM